jgi:hypothetical protein
MDIDPKQDFCYCHKHRHQLDSRGFLEPPKYNRFQGADRATGLCTSVVADTPIGSVLHGRNMDWNIPPILRKLVVDVEYQRSNKTVFTGTTIVGFVGVLNGMTAGPNSWSVSMDARGKGGKVFPNLLQALLHKSMTPTQLMRKALEQEGSSYATASAEDGMLRTSPPPPSN